MNERERVDTVLCCSGTMNIQVVHQFNFTLKLNAMPTPRLTDVPAQFNFNIKLNMARDGRRQSAHEGVRTAFNFKIKLECAPMSVDMSVGAPINFDIKLNCAATSVNGVGGA